MDFFPLINSLRISMIASLITLVVATASALYITKLQPRTQKILDGFFTLAMVLPPTVIGVLLLMVFAPKGLFGAYLQSYLGLTLTMKWQASILAVLAVTFPIMYRTARGAFEGMDKQQVQVAQTLGLKNRVILRKIILPQCQSGLIAGFVLSFARGLGEYGATSMVSGYIPGKTATISTAVAYYWETGQNGLALFWVTLNLLLACLMMVLICRINDRGTIHRKVV